MNDMTRESFLKTIWKPYPRMPAGVNLAGRLRKIDKGTVSLVDGEAIPCSHLENLEVLRQNDWVALRLEGEKVVEITLLAPCLEEPLELSSSQEIQQKWFEFLGKVRQYFSDHKFQEVQTPTLVACPGTEPFLDLFSTELKIGSKSKKLYLPTSPEIHLKKLVAAGRGPLFEIRPCFRNGEISEKHQPEFWMLEWYRPFASLEEIQQDCLNLIEFLSGEKQSSQETTMAELFQSHLDIKLTPQTTLADLKKVDAQLEKYELFDDAFFHLFVDKIEEKLSQNLPLFVKNYPPSQAALARLTEDGWGDRFELYWKGFELANAYHELNDPELQEKRLQEDLNKKRQTGREIPSLDTDFIRALRSGMPPTSGIALGLERLFMALYGIKDIRKLRDFPL
jgi:elongation factor P--(R)-beta-lysine ligase